MATKKEADSPAKRGPVKSFRANDISAGVFSREHNGRTYYSWVLTRAYRDASGNYQYTHNLNPEDAGTVKSLTEQVIEYFQGLEQDA